ncbi:MAG: transposase [bacterium]|nr:transposase [bacterium]
MISNKNYAHRPPHLFIDDWCYFLTARCQEKKNFFDLENKKKLFVKAINKAVCKFEVELFSWVLLDNHYHMLMRIKNSKNIPRFIHNLHANSSRLINDFDNKDGRKIWYQYWDYCIRNKKDFWLHFNYIIQNPLKHKLTETLEQAFYYEYSSNGIWLERFGKEGMSELFIKYPVIDWTPNEVDLN